MSAGGSVAASCSRGCANISAAVPPANHPTHHIPIWIGIAGRAAAMIGGSASALTLCAARADHACGQPKSRINMHSGSHGEHPDLPGLTLRHEGLLLPRTGPAVANTAVTWPGRLRQIHPFFRNRSPSQMLDTARLYQAMRSLPPRSISSRSSSSWLRSAPRPRSQYRARVAERGPDPRGDPRISRPSRRIGTADRVEQLVAGQCPGPLVGCEQPRRQPWRPRSCHGGPALPRPRATSRRRPAVNDTRRAYPDAPARRAPRER